jgi:hypothetical protein
MIKKNFMAGVGVFLLLLCACTSEDTGTDITGNICGQTPCYEGPFDPPWLSAHDTGLEFWDPAGGLLTHDNKVLETQHLLIFSDASEDWAKIEMGQTGESALAQIMGLFQVTPEELGITDLYSKIGVYSLRRVSANSGTRADINGYINWAHDTYNSWIEPDDILRSGKHECTHTVQFRLGGLYQVVWCWFTEGLAEHVSGGVFPPVTCWPEVEEWRQNPDHVNPVSIRVPEDMPGWSSNDGQTASQYYPLFGLATCYLVNPRGGGRTCIDVKNMFRDIAEGMDFPQAFQKHMGMELAFYESHFWELMQAFLPASCGDW